MTLNENGSEITLRVPDNWHVHFRQGQLLKFLVGTFVECGWRGRVLAEPNTQPPKLTGQDALAYKAEILAAAEGFRNRGGFEPVMTI